MIKSENYEIVKALRDIAKAVSSEGGGSSDDFKAAGVGFGAVSRDGQDALTLVQLIPWKDFGEFDFTQPIQCDFIVPIYPADYEATNALGFEIMPNDSTNLMQLKTDETFVLRRPVDDDYCAFELVIGD